MDNAKPQAEITPVTRAGYVFDGYAALDAPHLPGDKLRVAAHPRDLDRLQVMLARWQRTNFGGTTLEQNTLGVAEEVGELSHAVLKHVQGIRNLETTGALREAAGDAIADAAIYLIQVATHLRLDFGTLLWHTGLEVMKRDWKHDKAGGSATASK